MSDQHPQLIEALFLKARELPQAEREAFVLAQASTPAIAREVLQLLEHDLADDFLEQPLVPAALQDKLKQELLSVDAASPALNPTAPCTMVQPAMTELIDGRYKLLQPIGEGGFGVVYMAEQVQPVRRRVALKMLKSTMDTKNILARFASERQAMALMDHPHIAKILDGGFLPDQRPYFVMELVNGLPITQYCKEYALDQTSRMRLLSQVCLAVHHAHQRGVIHRDLKPTNILVSSLDGQPVPKVIDFGIAKALHGPLVEATLFTSFQQMIGTPEYMSPEQAETSLVDADTRSDVYSLGILAYELLTGVTPLDGSTLRKMGYGKLQQTIREYEPVRPSERLQTQEKSASKEVRKEPSRSHQTRSALRNELDWVVMKAIEKDRNRRYESAAAMAEDLQRWIAHDPIQARPPSLHYRLNKWILKHAWQTAVGAALLLGTLVASAGLGYGVSERVAAKERSQLLSEKNRVLQQSADSERERAERLLYGDAMVGAHEAFLAGRRRAVLDLLSECPPQSRGLEWQWQSYLAANRAQRIFAGTPQTGQTVLLTLKTGKGLVSAGKDGMVHQWDSTTGKLKHSWRASQGAITALVANGDGSQLLTASDRGELKHWQMDTGSLVQEAKLGKPGSVLALLEPEEGATAGTTSQNGDQQDSPNGPSNISPHFPCVAVGHEDGTIEVFQHALNTPPLTMGDDVTRHTGPLQTLAFLPANRQLVSAGKGGVMVWDWKTGRRTRAEGDAWQSYGALLSSRNQAIIYGPPVAAVDFEIGATPRVYDLPATGIWSADLADAQQQLYMATEEQAVRRVNLVTGKHETVGFFHDAPLAQVRIAPEGTWLAAITQDGSLWLLSADDWATPLSLDILQSEVAAVDHDPKTGRIWCIGENGQWIDWKPGSAESPHTVSGHEYQGFDIAFSERLNRLVTNGLDRTLKVWDVAQQKMVTQYQLALGARYLALHPDGVRLAAPPPRDLSSVADPSLGDVSQASGNMALWNLETGKVERLYSGLHNWAMKIAFSHDGNLLAAATVSDGVANWGKESGIPRFFKVDSKSIPVSVAFSPDDRFILAGFRDGQVHIWELAEGKHVRRIICHGDEVSELLFTPDGTRLLTACRSSATLKIWDWHQGQQVGALDAGVSGVTCLQWSQPGRRLVVGGVDGGVRLLKLAP